jgi:hypothetical protein
VKPGTTAKTTQKHPLDDSGTATCRQRWGERFTEYVFEEIMNTYKQYAPNFEKARIALEIAEKQPEYLFRTDLVPDKIAAHKEYLTKSWVPFLKQLVELIPQSEIRDVPVRYPMAVAVALFANVRPTIESVTVSVEDGKLCFEFNLPKTKPRKLYVDSATIGTEETIVETTKPWESVVYWLRKWCTTRKTSN